MEKNTLMMDLSDGHTWTTETREYNNLDFVARAIKRKGFFFIGTENNGFLGLPLYFEEN